MIIGPNYYAVDLSNLTEEQKEDVSQRLHELQETCMRLKGDGKIGIVYGNPAHVEALRHEGWNVSLYHGCGHCLQDMPNDGGRCDCQCHG